MQECVKAAAHKAAASSQSPAAAHNTTCEPRVSSDHSKGSAPTVAIKWLIKLFLSATVCRPEYVIFPPSPWNTFMYGSSCIKKKKGPSITFSPWKCICCEKEIMLQRHRTSEKMILDLFGSIWPWSEIAPYWTEKKTLRRLLQSFCALGVSWQCMIFRNSGSCFNGRSEQVNWNDITITNKSEWK